MRLGFTLIELLISIVIIALLVGLLIPTLTSVREAGRESVCIANLRQGVMACRAYADDFKGKSPAIGQPYGTLPNWALVVQSSAGHDGTTAADLYNHASVLVCPTIDAYYGRTLTRTYAMNATGHAGITKPEGLPDPDNYDDPDHPAYIDLDRVQRPTETPLLMDSDMAPIEGDAPPPSRTASVIDFRFESHVSSRLGRFHRAQGGRKGFDVGFCDGAARLQWEVQPRWRMPLP